jgi:hypothetical protein
MQRAGAMREFNGFIHGIMKAEVIGGDDQAAAVRPRDDYTLATGSTVPSGVTW